MGTRLWAIEDSSILLPMGELTGKGVDIDEYGMTTVDTKSLAIEMNHLS